jgi:hypothetical protein
MIERGHVGGSTVAAVRGLFAPLEARLELAPRWRGAELDRLLDEAHARIVAAVAARLEAAGWQVVLEVTYSEFGERGSIDVLGFKPEARAAIVVEVKSDIAAAEAVGRKLDEKARLAPKIIRDRFGWTPGHVAAVLVMPDTDRLRRLVSATSVLSRMFPATSRAVVSWLREPAGHLAGRWFLSNISARNRCAVRPRGRAGSTDRGSAAERAGSMVSCRTARRTQPRGRADYAR